MAIGSRNKVSANFNMSSMTDIVFLLLIFFMVTSTMISPNGLEVTLPSGNTQVSNNAQVSVSINKDLQYAINNNLVPPQQLEVLLQKEFAGQEKPWLLLRADKDVPTGETVKVMEIASRNKWKFTLATKPTGE